MQFLAIFTAKLHRMLESETDSKLCSSKRKQNIENALRPINRSRNNAGSQHIVQVEGYGKKKEACVDLAEYVVKIRYLTSNPFSSISSYIQIPIATARSRMIRMIMLLRVAASVRGVGIRDGNPVRSGWMSCSGHWDSFVVV